MYQFGPFIFDCRHRRLYRSGERVHLTNKAMTLLEILLEHRPELVGKEELIAGMWPDGAGTEGNLTVNVAALRRALGERRGSNDFIVTVPTRGYCFAAQVVDLEEDQIPEDGQQPPTRHLAVLPPGLPEEMTEEAYLAHWIADALIAAIAARSQLAVRPLSAVLDPRVVELPLADLARKLKVDLVLEGRLSREDGSLLLELQLVQPVDHRVLWNGTLRNLSEDLQDGVETVAADLSRLLDLPPSPPEIQIPRPPQDPEAFRLFLQGRFHLNRVDPSSVRMALDCLQRAVELERGACPRALACMAQAYHYLVIFGMMEAIEGFTRSEEALIRALAEDDNSSVAHAVLGSTRRLLHWDWEGAEESHRRAVRLGPLDPMSYEYLGYHLASTGRTKEALESFGRALHLDPSSLQLMSAHSWVLRLQGDYAAAEEMAGTVLRLDPHYLLGHYNHVCNLLAQDLHEQALAALDAAPRAPFLDPMLGQAQCGVGDERGLEATLTRIRESAGSEGNVHLNQSIALAKHPEPERCLDHLEEAARLRSGLVTTCLHDPLWAAVREQARFRALARRIRPAVAENAG